jgi:hypothetical protein
MSKGKQKKPGMSAGKQGMLLVLAALTVIAVSVFSTLIVKQLSFSGESSGQYRYRGFSLEEAQKACDAHARESLGRRLRVLSLDLHSTRTDEGAGRHKVFFVAEVYEDERRKGVAEEFFVTCYTRTDDDQVTTFQLAKDEDFVPQAVRKRSGNAFGL